IVLGSLTVIGHMPVLFVVDYVHLRVVVYRLLVCVSVLMFVFIFSACLFIGLYDLVIIGSVIVFVSLSFF
ncbi:hypothetical protein, partial [Klebsiella pneumoniae]|uniref:hypothetical protein n=1 Tax=Klebsiella pneumoniae TaxID=573 RepID=UPI0027314E97